MAIRPSDSWKTLRSRAAVGEALASPTPTLERTALEDSKPAMLLEKACRESCRVLFVLVTCDEEFDLRRFGTCRSLATATDRSLAVPLLLLTQGSHP